MRFGKLTILFLLAIVLGLGIYSLVREKENLRKEVNNLSSSVTALKKENESLSASIEYFRTPENLLKELKSQFNYRQANEGLIIIVPKVTSTNAQ